MPIAHFPAAPARVRATSARRAPRLPAAAALRTLLRREQLDREIAAGSSPGERPELAIRSRQLLSKRNRRSLAGGLEEAVAVSRGASRSRSAAPRMEYAEIRAAAPEMLELARELRNGPDISPAAVARVQLLLTDGLGPLYRCEHHGELIGCARAALALARTRH